MLKLSTREIKALTPVTTGRTVSRLTSKHGLPEPARTKHILLVKSALDCIPAGFDACFVLESERHYLPADMTGENVFVLPADQFYLSEGDVVRFDAEKSALRSIYRRDSRQNSLLVTERCNNYCLMCSQPPKEINDRWLVDELLEAIPLFDRATEEIGITGGEPTLLGDDLIAILRCLNNYLPRTAVHVLSNGRRFADLKVAQKVAAVGLSDLMIGIPVYSDVSHLHDYVVQADGAFDETIRGILNLKRAGVKVEVRVVIHKQTYERLPQLAMFLARNLLFVDHVALMGLEMMGFTKYNLDELWIDPLEYQAKLVEAVSVLDRYGMNVSIYNHQLCLLDKRIWRFNKKSISDWKNEYMPECQPCLMKDRCGGFFASARLRYSQHIKPFTEVTDATL